MSNRWTVAVYGATGALGREVRVALEGSDVDIETLVPVAGVRSAGETVPWRGVHVPVIGAFEVDPAAVDVAVIAAPLAVAQAEIPRLREAGAYVVDLSGARDTPEGPLPVLWPPLPIEDLEGLPGGFAIPCAPASTCAPAIDALCGAVGAPVIAVDVVELASATDEGAAGAEALSRQTVAMLSYQIVEPAPFRDLLAFNTLSLPRERERARGARFKSELVALLPGLRAASVTLTTVHIPIFAGITAVCTLRFATPPTEVAPLRAAVGAHPDIVLTDEGPAARDAIELDEVLASSPRLGDDGSVSLVLTADPLHRAGLRVAALLERLAAEEIW